MEIPRCARDDQNLHVPHVVVTPVKWIPQYPDSLEPAEPQPKAYGTGAVSSAW
jgi:hypothetical protein